MPKQALVLLIYTIFPIIISTHAQTPLLHIDFENIPDIITVTGIQGKAFDLGDVSRRIAFAKENPLKSGDDFTISVWVKGDKNAIKSYNILTAMVVSESDEEGWKRRMLDGVRDQPARNFNGWKMGMQENGAWSFIAKGKDDYTYQYKPMAHRQSIRDGEWHLLSVSYKADKSELRFFYDGNQMAVYNAPYLGDMIQADSLVIGNSEQSEYDFRESEWDSFYGQIGSISIYDRVLDEAEISEYYDEVIGLETPVLEKSHKHGSIKVTTFNIFHAGKEKGKEVNSNRIIDLLKQNGADIYALVETYGAGEKIADALGYELYLISSNLSILSRYPIADTYPIFRPFNSGGAQVILPGGDKINVFNVWLTHLPDYKRSFSKSADVDLEVYLEEEIRQRGTQMDRILNEINQLFAETNEIPLVLAGDFNSGSHLDWIVETKSMHNKYVVPWPVSLAIEEAGFIDSYRMLHPDPLKNPGITWPFTFKEDTYIKDRIDYIYYKGKKLTPITSTVINQHPIIFPSDHAGVSTLFKWD